MKNVMIYFIWLILLLMMACSKDEMAYGTVTDIDGNTYKTVMIGGQEWMAENLRTTKYRNGIKIPNVNQKAEWDNLTSGANCIYTKDMQSTVNLSVYGRLYNFYAVIDSNNIAPQGWHIPTKEDWQNLMDFYGGQFACSDDLKETKLFDVFGGRLSDDFDLLDISGYYWSSTEEESEEHLAYFFSIGGGSELFFIINGIKMPFPVIFLPINKKSGLSVRCVKD
jgi:uncharacterized protein (TIGR02145 family)